MNRIGPEGILAAAVAIWFAVTGLVDLLRPQPQPGRRAVADEPAWISIGRRVRGALEVLGALAVVAGAAIGLFDLRIAFPGRIVGLALAVLSMWGAAESVRPPVRWLRLTLIALGFALAVFYTGFRD